MKGKKPKLARVVVTQSMIGLCYMQVCAVNNATNKEILAVCNSENPAGTNNGWTTVIRRGAAKPIACGDYKRSRKHFLISC